MKVKYPKDKQKMVEDALHTYFPREERFPKVVYNAMRYSLFAGGKRFRPVLALTAGETFGRNPKDLLPTACAIECIHTYSLIHDDLPAIDNDKLRRGKPTCHIAFGEDIAILAGDALFAEAFYLIAKYQRADDPGKIVRVIQELSCASGFRGMVGGQVVDVASSGKKVSPQTLDFIHAHKTASLIQASAKVGAILAGAKEGEIEIISEYAHNLGMAFQIVDDILDVIGAESVLGKPIGSDKEKEKPTFPAVFGVEKSKKMAFDFVAKACRALDLLSQDTKALEELAQFVYERQS